MIKEIKVVKTREGRKVNEEVLGKVQVWENRISANVYEKYKKIMFKKYSAGRQECLRLYIEDKEVFPPQPFSDVAKIEE